MPELVRQKEEDPWNLEPASLASETFMCQNHKVEKN